MEHWASGGQNQQAETDQTLHVRTRQHRFASLSNYRLNCTEIAEEPASEENSPGIDNRQRNLVERFFNKLKQFRGIATRYDKDPQNFLAAVKLTATRIWIRSL